MTTTEPINGGRKTCCASCPWRRDSEPGAIGSKEPASTFIGQAHGPFLLPCHEAYEAAMGRQGWRKEADNSVQCCGAATFRANVGVDKLMPNGIHKVQADKENVFATAAEFLAHHEGKDVELCESVLQMVTPMDMCEREMSKRNELTYYKRG